MTIEVRYAASSPRRNASDVFGGVSGEADRNHRVFGMEDNYIFVKHKRNTNWFTQ
jgi:hypothetical protein